MQQQLTQLRNTWTGFPRRAQFAMIGVAIVTVIVLALVLRASTATTWVPVTSSNLPPEKLGQAQTTLEDAGFTVQVSKAGNAVEVPQDSVNKAEAALATAGIAAKGGRADCSKQFSQNSMVGGTSDQFAVKLETCRENQAANAIEEIAGVQSAKVDVTVPGKELFLDDQAPAKASVVVDTGTVRLPAKTVPGIQQLVASSFDGLTPDNVSILDTMGNSLSQTEADATGDAQSKKLEIENKFNSLIETKLGATLTDVVGEGNFAITSNAELDLDQIKRVVRENSPSGKDGDVLVSLESYEKELLNGVGSTSVQGVAGTGTNQGTAVTTTDPTTNVDQDNRTTTKDGSTVAGTDNGYVKSKGDLTYALNQVGEDINVAPGSVLRYRVGVIVDDSVPAATANAAKNMIMAWMGGNAPDSMSFDRAPLALATANKSSTTAAAPSPLAGYVKWALLGAGIIGLAFVMRRALTQRTAELLAPASDLLLLDAGDFTPIPIAELEAALAAAQPDKDRQGRMELQRKVEQIADAKPADVANELRRWMSQTDGGFPAPPRRA